MNTKLFRSRCNSMLSLFKLKRQIAVGRFINEETDVIDQLANDGKIRTQLAKDAAGWEEWTYLVVNTDPYPDSHDFTTGQIHPLVLELVAENPHNEEQLKLYKKNV